MLHHKTNPTRLRLVLAIQAVCIIAFVTAWLVLPGNQRQVLLAEVSGNRPPVDVPLSQSRPVAIHSLYDDPAVVSDEELAAVLKKVLPRFDRVRLRPNYVEHALRIWGSDIEFTQPALISGPEMVRFLTDTSRYIASWQDEAHPILLEQEQGIKVRWGPDRTASVHHDHLLTCLTEAGVSLDTEVFLPNRTMQVRDLLTEAISDFRLDEREVEWSVMTFGFWLAPERATTWRNANQRRITFDLLASCLMRNHKRHGICLGTHRVYSLMVLLRLNQQFGGDLMSDDTIAAITRYVAETSLLIQQTPNVDGSWPPNWTDGVLAAEKSDPEQPFYRTVISTGHHLEWLAIAPESFHPPRQRIREAAAWAIRDILDAPQGIIDDNYTYYSHVGNALALWRGTTPAEFWQQWRESHPDCEQLKIGDSSISDLDSSRTEGDHD